MLEGADRRPFFFVIVSPYHRVILSGYRLAFARMGLVSFLLRLPFTFLSYGLSITKNSVLIAAAIIYLGMVALFLPPTFLHFFVDHINMRNHLLQLKYRSSFSRDYIPIHARFYDSVKRLTIAPAERRD